MWSVTNHTPFAHHMGFLRDHTGRAMWCVWIKATFVLRHDQPALFAPGQRPVRVAPLFVADDPLRDLIEDTDLTPEKPMVDLVLAARAYPPRGSGPVYAAGVQVGGLTKVFHVGPLNDRPAPADLVWGNATGGPQSTDNPLGQPKGARVQPSTGAGPGGLNAIPRNWTIRSRLAGTYDAQWERKRAPMLPVDLQPAYWQSAPPDQRLPRPVPDSLGLALQHLTSQDGVTGDHLLRCTLPRLDLTVATKLRNDWTTQTAQLQTIFVDTPARQLSLCYQTSLPVGAAQNDVLVDESVITLEGHSGFRVAATDAHQFGGVTQTAALSEA
jgi:hypothetical protein